MDQRIQAVFITPETTAIFRIPVEAGLIEPRDIAASAERPIPRAVNHHMADSRIIPPCQQCSFESEAHIMRQRIQRLWPVQRHPAGTAFNPAMDVTH